MIKFSVLSSSAGYNEIKAVGPLHVRVVQHFAPCTFRKRGLLTLMSKLCLPLYSSNGSELYSLNSPSLPHKFCTVVAFLSVCVFPPGGSLIMNMLRALNRHLYISSPYIRFHLKPLKKLPVSKTF